MIRFGATAQTAVAAMSRLAEVYDGERRRLSSLDVASNRNLPKPLVAKVLTVLSTAGLVNGTRGPGGGYWLARAPAEITLAEIVQSFEREGRVPLCPFGPGWCGSGHPCPVHESFATLQQDWSGFLERTTLAVFAAAPKPTANEASSLELPLRRAGR